MTIWAVLVTCLAATATAGAAKPPHGNRAKDHGPAGRLDGGFGRHGRVVVSGPDAPAEPRGDSAPQFSAVGRGGRVIVATGDQVRAFRPDGTPDTGFGEGGMVTLPAPAGENFHLAGVAVDPKGRVLVAGQDESLAPTVGTTPDGHSLPRPATVTIYRLLADGRPDPRFGVGGEAQPSLDRPMPDTTPQREPAWLFPLSTGFGMKTTIEITGLAVDPEGRPLLLGASPGLLQYCLGTGAFAFYTDPSFAARLTAHGDLDVGFGSAGVIDVPRERPSGLAALRGGGVAFETSPKRRCDPPEPAKERLHVLGPRGSVRAEPPIGPAAGLEAASVVQGVSVDPMGRILALSADSKDVDGDWVSHEVVRRYLPDGSPDPSFGRDGKAEVRLPGKLTTNARGFDLAVDPAGRPVVAGVPESADPSPHPLWHPPLLVTRLTSSGRPDRTFGAGGTTTTNFDARLYSTQGGGPGAAVDVAADARDRVTVAGRLTCTPTSRPCRPFLVRYLGG